MSELFGGAIIIVVRKAPGVSLAISLLIHSGVLGVSYMLSSRVISRPPRPLGFYTVTRGPSQGTTVITGPCVSPFCAPSSLSLQCPCQQVMDPVTQVSLERWVSLGEPLKGEEIPPQRVYSDPKIELSGSRMVGLGRMGEVVTGADQAPGEGIPNRSEDPVEGVKASTRGAGESGYIPAKYSPGLNPPISYPEWARVNGIEGRVVLIVKVSAEGRCEKVSVKESSGYKILDEAAISGIKRWLFDPAIKDGKAVGSLLEIPVRFQLVD